MKIAVLSDIHANFHALETVIDHIERWEPGLVIVAGDTVNRGPRSLCCLKAIEEKQQQNGWLVIRGNHEDYVIERENPNDPREGVTFDLYQPVHFTYKQIIKNISYLHDMPHEITRSSPLYGNIRVRHGSMLSNRDGIYPENTRDELVRKISPPPDVFITGHTHRPLVRNLDGTLIVNAGSVGLPFDGDTRTTYAQISYHNGSWYAKIIRLKYDLKSTENDYLEFGFFEDGGPLVNLILLELKSGLGQLYPWVSKFNQRILKHEITVEDSVNEFLENPVTKPYWYKKYN